MIGLLFRSHPTAAVKLLNNDEFIQNYTNWEWRKLWENPASKTRASKLKM